VHRACEREARVEPADDRRLDLSRMRNDRHQPIPFNVYAVTMISSGVFPCFHSRFESGYAAGPCATWPVIVKREPWQGHSKRLPAGVQPREQPSGEQFTANTLTWPAASFAA